MSTIIPTVVTTVFLGSTAYPELTTHCCKQLLGERTISCLRGRRAL